MSIESVEELADGAENLDLLLLEQHTLAPNLNEAETRFHLIDRILISCLGWDRSLFRLEVPQGREYSDYEVGKPVSMIWEAKREGKQFEIPKRRVGSLIHNISSIIRLSPDCRDAITQVNNYCIARGVELAVATNGHQIIAFKAETEISIKNKSKCVVFDCLETLRSNFPRAWQLLSPGGVGSGSLFALLANASAPLVPLKLSKFVPDYPQFRQSSDLQRSMSDIAEMILLSVEEQTELEKKFFKECYCESGALSQHALISKQMLNARYHSLFPDAADAPTASPVVAKGGKPQLTPAILAEAISNRPIALVGDVGVGKSSFLKHLMHVSAYSEFQYAIYAYVNLGRKGALSESVAELVLDQIEKSLIENYDIDIMESSFVRSVYKKEIKRFEKSIWGESRESNPERYEDKLLEMLDKKQSDRAEYLKHCIEYLSKERRKQIIIAIDNADQRSTSVQQEAFIVAQNLSADWKATVFISVRPRTFFLSKRSGTLAAYPHRVFTIAPPRIDQVIEKRLSFAHRIAEGKVQLDRLHSISFRLGNTATLIEVLQASIDRFDAVKVFLENITAGNVRELIQFLVSMFGNPNVDLHGTVLALEQTGQYFIPLHDFWKVALKGDYQYFDPEKVLAANLFDVASDSSREHFLLPMILGLLNENTSRRNSEGFVEYSEMVDELQKQGFKPESVGTIVRRANNKKLIESPERITFEEDDDGAFGVIPTAFRISSNGVYHLTEWSATFSYLDAVCVDTPIFDEVLASDLRVYIRSFALEDRYSRSMKFRDYLSQIWAASGLNVTYFDWDSMCILGQASFDPVAQSLARRGNSRFR